MIKKVLGVLGGMGPAASARFYSMLTNFTKAECDQNHMEILLHSLPSIPDRTAFILKQSADDPFERIKTALEKLENAGAEIIAVPCNTAEYFYSKLQSIISVPILSITKAAVLSAYEAGFSKVGILATEGTIYAGTYQKACNIYGLQYDLPSDSEQDLLNDMIYKYIKRSLPVPYLCVLRLLQEFGEHGCDAYILGCTELSFISNALKQKNYKFIDSLEALALQSIKACGYEVNPLAVNT
ncbi:MAG: aspartate/glutamate racemase family protein [Clostridia bacterium]|nr:aspartate/glutamate racemase family protein [Clostridia bacterium]